VVYWIDLALAPDEASLRGLLNELDARARGDAIANVADRLGLTREDVERAALRLLVERVRLFALPSSLWNRDPTASDDPRARIRSHFTALGVTETPERVDSALRLYLAWIDGRGNPKVKEADLVACGYRCQHCGLAFHNEELLSRGFESPFGSRAAPKKDPLKPHWHVSDEERQPTIDHDWPVALFGDNRPSNLRVLCSPCNAGKEHYVAGEQMWPAVGLPRRKHVMRPRPVANDVFYAQLRRAPRCEHTGRGPTEVELTVELRDPNMPSVLDNLRTVESPAP
jgi:hypothetical protein